MTEFEKYLEQQYQFDFKSWFQMEERCCVPFGPSGIYGLSDTKPSKCSDTTVHQYYFSIATFFNLLIPQVVGKVTNAPNAMYACCTSLNAPVYWAGQYGIADPYSALLDCHLLPFKNEKTSYFELLRHILHLYLYRTGDFLDGNDEHAQNISDPFDESPYDDPQTKRYGAYEYVVEACKGKKQQILDEIISQTERFIAHIVAGDNQPMPIISTY